MKKTIQYLFVCSMLLGTFGIANAQEKDKRKPKSEQKHERKHKDKMKHKEHKEHKHLKEGKEK